MAAEKSAGGDRVGGHERHALLLTGADRPANRPQPLQRPVAAALACTVQTDDTASRPFYILLACLESHSKLVVSIPGEQDDPDATIAKSWLPDCPGVVVREPCRD